MTIEMHSLKQTYALRQLTIFEIPEKYFNVLPTGGKYLPWACRAPTSCYHSHTTWQVTIVGLHYDFVTRWFTARDLGLQNCKSLHVVRGMSNDLNLPRTNVSGPRIRQYISNAFFTSTISYYEIIAIWEHGESNGRCCRIQINITFAIVCSETLANHCWKFKSFMLNWASVVWGWETCHQITFIEH